jgi:Family of unknown function (DUF6166)
MFPSNNSGHTEVFYSGEQFGRVTVREGRSKRPLDPRFDLQRNSRDAFSWGKGSEGAAQLSVALLADALQNDARALRLHSRFNERVVNIFPERWTVSRSRILAYVNMIEQQAFTGGIVP